MPLNPATLTPSTQTDRLPVATKQHSFVIAVCGANFAELSSAAYKAVNDHLAPPSPITAIPADVKVECISPAEPYTTATGAVVYAARYMVTQDIQ